MGTPIKDSAVNLVRQVKDDLLVKLDQADASVREIVEQGAASPHHDVPAATKILPAPIGHCQLSSQPLYPPPSIEVEESISAREQLKELGHEVKRCLKTKAGQVTARSVKDMDEFSESDSD